jgi:hypothetical protein
MDIARSPNTIFQRYRPVLIDLATAHEVSSNPHSCEDKAKENQGDLSTP